MSEQENILKLKEMIEVSDNIVFYGERYSGFQK